MTDFMRDELGTPKVVDRSTFQAELDALRLREKAHMREGDAIAAARRRLPMVEVDGATPLIGEHGTVTLLDAFEGRRQLIAYYFMWHAGQPAAEQCEGCTLYTSQVRELSFIHSRDVTYATFAQGPYEESTRYRDFMGWEMPWYAAPRSSLDTLLVGRRVGMMHIVCYLRHGSDVFETYWTTRRGVEVMDNSYRVARLDRLWAAGGVGGLAGRLAATAEGRAPLPYRWTSHRPVAPREGRAFRRSGNRQALNPMRDAADWISLAAAPTFAIMALLTGVFGGGPHGYALLCRAWGVSVERNGPDVCVDERLPFDALAETDLRTTKRSCLLTHITGWLYVNR